MLELKSCSILASESIISSALFPKYSPNAASIFSKLANVHSESPINQTFSGIIEDCNRLRIQERRSREAMTAPLSSDLGVEILYKGVTLDFAHNNETCTDPSARVQCI